MSACCSPTQGSEPGVGWHRALESARYFDTWVITRDDRHAEETRQFLAARGEVPGLQFVFVPEGPLIRLLMRVRGPSYWAYRLWLRRALGVARELHARIHFDLAHQVNFCTFREPGYLWKLDVPLVWGPVGGTQNYPWLFLGEAGPLEAVSETVRNVLNRLQLHWSWQVHRAARRAKVFLAATSTNQHDLARALGVTPRLLLETGIDSVAETPRRRDSGERPFRILWVGYLIARKALSLLLRALARLPREGYDVRVVGRGPRRHAWQRLARQLGVAQRIEWIEAVPHGQMHEQYAWADTLVFSSLRDTTGNVNLEALSAGLPVICLDHQGVHDIVNDECGIPVPVTSPGEVFEKLAAAIARLAQDADLWERLSAGALRRAKCFLWSRQGEAMAEFYRSAMDDRGGSRG